MSIPAISGNSSYDYSSPIAQHTLQQFQQEFQRLGQDLQSGSLSTAQADFAMLQQSGTQSGPASSAQAKPATSSQGNDPIHQEFNQLSQDLQSGNLSGAQQDYAALQQDFRDQATQMAQGQGHHRHHHSGEGSGTSAISQLINQLGQALQFGNLSMAQQAYGILQQDLQGGSQSSGQPAQPSLPSSNSISVNA